MWSGSAAVATDVSLDAIVDRYRQGYAGDRVVPLDDERAEDLMTLILACLAGHDGDDDGLRLQ